MGQCNIRHCYTLLSEMEVTGHSVQPAVAQTDCLLGPAAGLTSELPHSNQPVARAKQVARNHASSLSAVAGIT